MWVLDGKGQLLHVKCDVCGEVCQYGAIVVKVGPATVAEACGPHAEKLTQAVQSVLKTNPGPPPVEEQKG